MAADEKLPAGFLAFWNEYRCDRRVNRRAALDQWTRLECEGMAEEVLAALVRFKGTRKWIDGYMQEPARWLRSEPWHDDPVPHEIVAELIIAGYPVTKAQLESWGHTFPDVMVPETLAEVAAWMAANPDKYPRDVHSFIVKWLQREQSGPTLFRFGT